VYALCKEEGAGGLTMTSQASLSKYSTSPLVRPPPAGQEVCKRCRHLTKLEERYYCKLLQAFLANQTLSLPCDLLEGSS